MKEKCVEYKFENEKSYNASCENCLHRKDCKDWQNRNWQNSKNIYVFYNYNEIAFMCKYYKSEEKDA